MKNSDGSKQMQYSKKILTAMIRLWFAGAVFGMIFVSVQLCILLLVPEITLNMPLSLDAILNYIGIPMTGGTVGYLLKSAIENKEKIQHGTSDEDHPL
ncbi:MAG: hypothetical protein IJ325_13740 [Clostridia bacterium]|nr:hypothetical protein [Clostridia bacterium]